jgi:hypothetical protein
VAVVVLSGSLDASCQENAFVLVGMRLHYEREVDPIEGGDAQ